MAVSHLMGQVTYAFKQGNLNIIRSPFMSLVVVSTMAIALTTLGFLLLVISDLNTVSDTLATQLKIVVFLEDQQDLDRMASDIENIGGVKLPVTKITRAQALENMSETMPELKELYKDDNPFPATIEVEVIHIDRMEDVGEQIKDLPGTEEVQFNPELAKQLDQMQSGIQLVGSVLASILILATLAIMINTIQLAVHQRKEEIEIMRLVGAPHWFVRLPFLLEGVAFGASAAVVSSLVLLFWRVVPYPQIQRWFSFLPLPTSLGPLLGISALLLATGILMGLAGSGLSVGRYLRLEFKDD